MQFKYRLRKHEEILEVLRSVKGPVLDIGCGENPLGDVNVDVVKYGHGNVVCDLQKEKLGYPARSFGAIVLSDSLEHIKNPRAVFRECHRLLKDNGKLIVTIPNCGNLLHRVGIWKDEPITGNPHVNSWTRKSFVEFLHSCNFMVENVKGTYYKRGRLYAYFDPFCLLFVSRKRL
ncbi:MAG: class I SAM-dependent methyltransferase [Candidatus Aenigmarchaeota archaeon]|nr:class I SAM-dependent methyltransferase [Candidatus Aenigmarchaeota archaeon]